MYSGQFVFSQIMHLLPKHEFKKCVQRYQGNYNYPEPLRRVRYYDGEIQKRFVFFTNNFNLPALTIAQLYKARWRVELFSNG